MEVRPATSGNTHSGIKYCYRSSAKSQSHPNGTYLRLLKTQASESSTPCRVLSSSKRALSAPLSRYTYDYKEGAFTNQKGYTWTPIYLRHCPSPFIISLPSKVDSGPGYNKSERNSFRLVLPAFDTKEVAITSSWFWSGHKEERENEIKKPISYSKFMQSPYLY